jgi:hypothetical protein
LVSRTTTSVIRGATPEDLVKRGKGETLKRYLSRIAEGGYT